jgi:hypothetical protein
VGVGRHASSPQARNAMLSEWRESMRRLAALPNTRVKLGGGGMPVLGFHLDQDDLPPTSALLADTLRPYVETCIELFGVTRCMFESNFPVDKGMFSYHVLWNAFKRIASSASEDEKRALFSETAAAVRQGQIDGLISVDPVITMLTDSHDLNVVADMRTASGVQAALGSAQYPEAAILTTADFIAKNPHTVQAVVNAIVRAEKFLQTATPDEVTDALPTAYQLGNRQTFVAAYKNSQPIFSADGRFDPAGPVAVFNILSKFDKELADAKGRIDIPSTYTNRFVDAVRH